MILRERAGNALFMHTTPDEFSFRYISNCAYYNSLDITTVERELVCKYKKSVFFEHHAPFEKLREREVMVPIIGVF